MNATAFLQQKIEQMDHDATNFETAMKRTPVADSKETAQQTLVRLREKHRKPVPKTPQDEAAAFLANINEKG